LHTQTPVPLTLKQSTHECLSTLRHLQIAMKEQHAIHREAKRVVRRTPTQETKYSSDHSRSATNLTRVDRRRNSTWYHSPQISALANRVDSRVRSKQKQFRSRERTSPV
jgi:hypothetical protein